MTEGTLSDRLAAVFEDEEANILASLVADDMAADPILTVEESGLREIAAFYCKMAVACRALPDDSLSSTLGQHIAHHLPDDTAARLALRKIVRRIRACGGFGMALADLLERIAYDAELYYRLRGYQGGEQ